MMPVEDEETLAATPRASPRSSNGEAHEAEDEEVCNSNTKHCIFAFRMVLIHWIFLCL